MKDLISMIHPSLTIEELGECYELEYGRCAHDMLWNHLRGCGCGISDQHAIDAWNLLTASDPSSVNRLGHADNCKLAAFLKKVE